MTDNNIEHFLKQEIPELRNAPQLLNSMIVLLREINKVAMRINELKSDKKISVEINTELNQ